MGEGRQKKIKIHGMEDYDRCYTKETQQGNMKVMVLNLINSRVYFKFYDRSQMPALHLMTNRVQVINNYLQNRELF